MSSITWRSIKKSYSKRKSFHWKPLAREVSRFAATVICSVLVTLWAQGTREEAKASAKRKTKVVAEETAPSEPWSQELNDFYSSYLAEVLRSLRANRTLRLAQIEIPGSALSYQRNIATTEEGGESFRLRPRSKMIPVIAVTRTAKDYLEEMRVTYIDPQSLPASVIKAAPAISQNFKTGYLLIPNVTGPHAKRFQFGK